MAVSKQNVLNTISESLNTLYDNSLHASVPFCAMLALISKAYKGKEVPSEDVDFIATRIAVKQGWSDKAMKVRKSEFRTIFGQYQQAPEAIKKATLLVKSKGISFSACLKVCRALKQGKSITAAAQSALYKSATIPAKSKTKAEAVKSVKGHVKRILEHTQLPAAFRTELKKLAAEYDVLQTS